MRFKRLYDDVKIGKVCEPCLSDLEAKDNIFPDVDYGLYAS